MVFRIKKQKFAIFFKMFFVTQLTLIQLKEIRDLKKKERYFSSF